MAKLHYRESPSASQKKSFAPYLAEDEELLLVAGLSSAFMRSQYCMYLLFPGLIIGVIVAGLGWFLKMDLGPLLLLGLVADLFVAFLKTLHLYHSNRYLFTTRRIIVKTGLFSVKLTGALYNKITHIEVEQGFVDRFLLHHGTIIVNTAGMNKDGIAIRYVDYPIELKNLLERLINREREQFGIKAGAVSAMEGEIIPD